MSKVQIFLIVDGVVIVGGLLFFLLMFLRKKESNFRDDLWVEKKRQEDVARKIAVEDQVDKKILLEHRSDPMDSEEKTAPIEVKQAPEFRVPNFRGKAHEVLGVPIDANKELIQKAFKHWIKRYHPDRVSHLGSRYVEQARRRAEQLNSARDELLRGALRR
jgi:DnaJ-domain-containing protein 1